MSTTKTDYLLVKQGDEYYGGTESNEPEGSRGSEGTQTVDDVMTVDEQMKVFAVRILSSTGYYVLCFAMIAVSTFLIVWLAAGDTESHWWFVLLEVIVTVTIVLEVALQICADGKAYWESVWNIFDFIVMLLCIASFMVYLFEQNQGQKGDDTAALTVLTIRYVAQGLRVIALVRRAKQSQDRENVSPVNFNTTADPSEKDINESGLAINNEEDLAAEEPESQP